MNTKTELLSYQEEAVKKLKRIKVGALFMDMGTGKTRTALELIKGRLNSGKVDAVLWLHPCSIKSDLEKNIMEHSDLMEGESLHMCGIETLSVSVRENVRLLELVEKENVFLIVDESSLIKNPAALRSKNIIRLAKKCEYKLILNGTPVSRNEADLFNQFYLLDWRILGYRSYWSFEANHVQYDDDNPKRIARILNTEYLARKIEPYTYECKKEDVLNVPDVKYNEIHFSMTDRQAENYAYVIDKLIGEIDEFRPETIYQFFSALQAVISGFHVKVKYTKRKKPYLETTYMFENAMDNPRMKTLFHALLDKNKDKHILFCNYAKEIETITKFLNQQDPGIAVAFHGEMGLKQREQALEEFSGNARYFIANKGCGSYGLNLQFCHNITYVSNDWDWGTRKQSENRVIRIGQKEDVLITDLVCRDSIDIKILDCLRKKENLANAFKRELKGLQNIKNFARGK